MKKKICCVGKMFRLLNVLYDLFFYIAVNLKIDYLIGDLIYAVYDFLWEMVREFF